MSLRPRRAEIGSRCEPGRDPQRPAETRRDRHVMERQLVAFHTEAKNDDEPFPIDARDAAELRMALRTAREERVGDEEVFEL